MARFWSIYVRFDAKVEIWNAETLKSERQMMIRGCNWLKDYLKHNVRVDQADRLICDRIQ
jgi:hypothetical protein